MDRSLLRIALLLLLTVSLFAQKKSAPPAEPALKQDPLFTVLKSRSIGPAIMGGRVSDIAFDPKEPSVYYLTLGTGGIMKTEDNGATFSAIFEKEEVAAMGAIAVSPMKNNFVWAGSGEANDRNSSSWGNGVYLSSDGGGSWKNIGLKESRTIARVVLPPRDTSTAYVAAMGDLWNLGGERGLYKTTDAGKSWQLILSAPAPFNNRIGCGDVVIDTANPNILYAALYARQRTPWSFTYGTALTDGKDAGGIFKSTDAGATWTKLTNGLPGMTGRIGLAIYRKNPATLFAVVQSDEGGTSNIDEVKSKSGGIFRTTDAGASWTRVNALNPRPFYFSQIRVDPADSSRLYVLGYQMHVSVDGGRSFREDFFKNVHADCHALAFDPTNPKHILLGTDGGIYSSYAGGKNWQHMNNFAAGEFYRIAADMSTPYRIAGGLQDNTNWVGPSRTYSKEGILNYDWTNLDGGDGFSIVFDPDSSHIIYAESQAGYVHRMNLSNGEVKGLRPEPTEGQPAFRFHWNSPLIPSRHQKGTMYLGGNHVFKFWERGEKWKRISPDLSAQDPKRILTTGSGAENYAVVYTLAESPLRSGLLWAGCDDGKLWVTENDGETWTDLSENLPKNVRGQWISRIEASHVDPKVAYVAIDAHRSGTFAPLAFRTADGGKSWSSVAGNLPENGPVKVLREDPKNPALLYAGTEFHLFVSTNMGAQWSVLSDLPTVAVDDIIIHPRDRDLIAATHGRSLYVIDDVGPLQEFADSIRAKELHCFTPRPAFGRNLLPGFAESNGNAVFRGANPPDGAILTYYLKEFKGEPVSISITDTAGHTVANLSGTNTPGFNRVVWDLKITKDLLTDYGGQGQAFVRPGIYTVTVSSGKLKHQQKLMVDIAPGIETR